MKRPPAWAWRAALSLLLLAAVGCGSDSASKGPGSAQSAPGAQPESEGSKFRRELGRSKDPVALAIPRLADRDEYCAMLARGALNKHWEDPRVEPALVEAAKAKPQVLADGLLTNSGYAADLATTIRARKEHQALLAGAQTPAAKVGVVRGMFDKHPKWLTREDRPRAEAKLACMLLQTAVAADGDKVVDLVMECPWLRSAEFCTYVTSRPRLCAEYARNVGVERAMAMQWLLPTLATTEEGPALRLLTEWLNDAKDEQTVHGLVQALGCGAGGERRLLSLLGSETHAAVREAVWCLCQRFPSRETFDAASTAIKRCRDSEMSAEHVAEMERCLSFLADDLASKRASQPKPEEW